MDFRLEARRLRQALADAALTTAREIEAGRASAPFQDKLAELAGAEPALPVRAAILAPNAETAQALLADMVGHDFNVCKVVVPSRLGFSEIMLQERGFLLDTGSGPKEFDDVGSFVSALQQTQVLPTQDDAALEPLRFKLKGPAHLNGLCLLIPHSLDAVQRRPALLSTLSDQADWIFLAGNPHTTISAEQRQTIQLMLDHVTGLQNVLVTAGEAVNGNATDEWYKGWKVTLSLGLVRQGTDVLRARLSLLTLPQSELRQYLVETRLARQLETTLLLMDEEVQQAQRLLGNRLQLAKEGLLGESGSGELRKQVEAVKTRLAEEAESLVRAIERDAKAAFAPDADGTRRLRDAAAAISTDDIEQTPGETTIKLTVANDVAGRLQATVTDLGRERLAADVRQLREGLECSMRDAEAALEKTMGARPKLPVDLPDDAALWQTLSAAIRPEVRYRGEMPRPTLGSRFQAARQGIMGLMIVGTVLGGVATLTGDGEGGDGVRTMLYALMVPLLIVGFLWTYVSFRKKERVLLEKEVEKLQDGVGTELRRACQEFAREQQGALSGAVQRIVRAAHQQIDAALERIQQARQREAEEARKRQLDQQRASEQRVMRYRQLGQQLAGFRTRHAELQKLQRQWLAAWIERFNQGKA